MKCSFYERLAPFYLFHFFYEVALYLISPYHLVLISNLANGADLSAKAAQLTGVPLDT